MDFDEIIKDAIHHHSEDTEWKITTRVVFEHVEMYRKNLTVRLKVFLDLEPFKQEEEDAEPHDPD